MAFDWSRASCDALFTSLDKTNDGKINFLELKKGIGEITESTGRQISASRFWKNLDGDGDKLATADEFYAFMMRVKKRVDSDPSGNIRVPQTQNTPGGVSSEVLAKQTADMKQADKDWIQYHPDLRKVTSRFLAEVFKAQPDNVTDFAVKFFTNASLKNFVKDPNASMPVS